MKTKQWLLMALSVTLGFAAHSVPALSPAASGTNKIDRAEPAKVSAPEPAVARQNNVNVRGQAAINSDVVVRLQKNQPVTILEEITLKKPAVDEPAKWYRITLPTNTAVWVHGDFINATNKTVKPRRLNLRSGPGENYSIVGRIEKGTVVSVITNKQEWLKIDAPAGAYGFVAAHLLAKEPAKVEVASAKTIPVEKAPLVAVKPVPETDVVAEVKPTLTELKTNETIAVAQSPILTNTVTPAPLTFVSTLRSETNAPALASTNATSASSNLTTVTASPPIVTNTAVAATMTATNEPELIKRVVLREGMLRGRTSIQAPSYFELRSLDNNRLINYVWSPSTNLVLKQFKGKKVLVTGEEILDERWPNTPVITVDTIDDSK